MVIDAIPIQRNVAMKSDIDADVSNPSAPELDGVAILSLLLAFIKDQAITAMHMVGNMFR